MYQVKCFHCGYEIINVYGCDHLEPCPICGTALYDEEITNDMAEIFQQLTEEKQEIESKIKEHESEIERAKNQIYWQKKRLKLVDAQLKSLPEEKEKV